MLKKSILTILALSSFVSTALASDVVYLPFPVNASQELKTCSFYKNSSKGCDEIPDGNQKQCEICKEEKSCFMAYDGPNQSFCEAYIGKKSCFMAFESASDRGWCERVVESKSCFMALDGSDRQKCEEGLIPARHRRWAKIGGKLQ